MYWELCLLTLVKGLPLRASNDETVGVALGIEGDTTRVAPVGAANVGAGEVYASPLSHDHFGQQNGTDHGLTPSSPERLPAPS